MVGISRSSGNLYLAHSVMRFTGETGTGCGFRPHSHLRTAEWEFCFLQNLDWAADLLRQGANEEAVNQKIWDDGCKEQDLFGTPRFYHTLRCCRACAFQLLTGHANRKHLARSMIALAETRSTALLLVSERSTMLPLIIATVPYTIQAAEIGPLLKTDLAARRIVAFPAAWMSS